jgi:dolichyl-phosphate beta-glucosyltransferase
MPGALSEMVVQLKGYAAELASSGEGPFTWEIIIVDDGSTDNTAEVAQAFSKTMGSDKVRFLKLEKNVGKGGAVRKGVLRARGAYVLFADADGATRAGDFVRLLNEAKRVERFSDGQGLSFALGSRSHIYDQDSLPEVEVVIPSGEKRKKKGPKVQRSAFRTFLMRGFHQLVSTMVSAKGHKYQDPAFATLPSTSKGSFDESALVPIRDTQCGFKMFSREAARQLFSVLHIERWAFDVELVLLASRKGIPMVEVPVNWQEVGGSKVKIISASLQMARDIFTIKAYYSLGVWSDTVPKHFLVGDSAAIDQKRKEAKKIEGVVGGTTSRFEGDDEAKGIGSGAESGGTVAAGIAAEEGRKAAVKRSNARKFADPAQTTAEGEHEGQ